MLYSRHSLREVTVITESSHTCILSDILSVLFRPHSTFGQALSDSQLLSSMLCQACHQNWCNGLFILFCDNTVTHLNILTRLTLLNCVSTQASTCLAGQQFVPFITRRSSTFTFIGPIHKNKGRPNLREAANESPNLFEDSMASW